MKQGLHRGALQACATAVVACKVAEAGRRLQGMAIVVGPVERLLSRAAKLYMANMACNWHARLWVARGEPYVGRGCPEQLAGHPRVVEVDVAHKEGVVVVLGACGSVWGGVGGGY